MENNMKTVTLADLTFGELKSIYFDLEDAWGSDPYDSEPAAVEAVEIAVADGDYSGGKPVAWDTPQLCLVDIWDLLKSKSGPGPKK